MIVLWNHNFSWVHQTLARRYLSLSKALKLLDLSFLFFLLDSPSFVSAHAQLLGYGTCTTTIAFFSQSFSVSLFSCNIFSWPYALTYTLTDTFTFFSHCFYSQWVIPHTNANSLTLTIYTSSSYLYIYMSFFLGCWLIRRCFTSLHSTSYHGCNRWWPQYLSYYNIEVHKANAWYNHNHHTSAINLFNIELDLGPYICWV